MFNTPSSFYIQLIDEDEIYGLQDDELNNFYNGIPIYLCEEETSRLQMEQTHAAILEYRLLQTLQVNLFHMYSF